VTRVKIPFRTIAALAAAAPFAAVSAADWMQFGYDAAHSGYNTSETTLGAANVDQIQRRYQTTLTASVDSAPVYLSNVSTSGGTKNLLFLLGTNGTLMAVDAADGSVFWHHQVSGQNPTTSAPAIDPGRQYVYAYGLDGYVHKYHVNNGSEVTTGGWPELITLKTDVEKVAGSLTIATSGATTYLYVVTDGYAGDFGDYQGHLTTIDLATGDQNVFNVQCSDQTIHFDSGANNCAWPMAGDTGGSGIWGRGGATFDAGTNRVFIATGNGFFNANVLGNYNWGDSVLALVPAGVASSGGGLPDDSYTPTNFQQLEDQDTDLGSTSLVILPTPAAHATQHVGVQIGKDAQIRLLDTTNMSGTNLVGSVGGELQLIDVPQGGGGMSEQPAIWIDGNGDTWLMIANRAGVSGLKLRFSNLSVPFLEVEWSHAGNARSAVVANDVLYYAAACGSSYCMYAADPVTGDVLWTSSEHLAALHWQSPIVVNGAIYIADGTHLSRFDAGDVAADTIFANGFDP